MRKRMLAVAVAAVVAALVGGACFGGGDDETPVVPADQAPTTGETPASDGQAEPDGGIDEDTTSGEAGEPDASATDDAATPDGGDDDSGDAVTTPDETSDDGESASRPELPAGGIYTIQQGDTLFDLAIRFDTTIDEIVALNGLDNPNDLFVGQEIRIPGLPEDEPDAEDEAEEETVADAPDATDDQAPDEPTGETPPSGGAVGTSPGTIAQPDPDVTVEEVPEQPANFAAYGATALPWLQGRTEVDEILELFTTWVMPPASELGDRLNLIDTDLDGLASLVVVFTDPASFGQVFVESNLVVFDPLPGQPGRYQIAYDYRLAKGDTAQSVAVLSGVDRTGEGERDILFVEETCGAHTCTSSFHLLAREGDGYRDLATAPIDIPSVRELDVESDVTGDGLPDLSMLGGTFGSVGAEPQREFRYVFSAAGGSLTQVVAEGQPSQWLVWALLDANAAFARQDWATAVSLYNVVLSDNGLEEWAPEAGEAAELRALANLRKSIALAQTGDSVGASAAAQALAAGSGIVAEAGAAYLTSFASSGDVGAACAAFDGALSVARWDEFWSHYGYGVPRLAAAALCPG